MLHNQSSIGVFLIFYLEFFRVVVISEMEITTTLNLIPSSISILEILALESHHPPVFFQAQRIKSHRGCRR